MASTPSTKFPIVGIGASAGGVEAIEGVFRRLPPDSGCAFVIVTHLSPERRSLLPEIIARYTEMPVHEAAQDAAVQPNQVYVLPADTILDIRGGRLQLRQLSSSPRRERKPIDIFFTALALDQGEYAAGVILSGGDGDGTLGVKAIKERGGLTLAQVADGDGPKHPDMPDSAIATGLIDFAVPAKEMGARLAEFALSFEQVDALTSAKAQGGERAIEAVRQEICAILRNQLGHDFAGYKQKTFLRRVHRRMQVSRLETLEGYVEQLRQDPTEVLALFRDLLINVTNFFRDADAFKVLEEQVVPKLFAGRGADETVRVWVPGCATGEEVFSIAILLREHMDGLTAVPRVQVFATDIDEAALGVARAARYPAALLDGISPERRKRFFINEDGGCLVSKDVRDLCVFSPHSVIRDPPFSRLDLISCRNLLIYFGADVQDQVIPTFHYALRPGGYLFLGTSENVSQFTELFTPLDKKHRVFRRREGVSSTLRLPLSVGGVKFGPLPANRPNPAGLIGAALRQLVESHVLDRIAPAHVVVNREGDLVYYSARTGKYLEATPGAPSRQLLTMARRGLRLELRALLREAIHTGQRAARDNVVVETDGDRVQRLALSVEPLGEPADNEQLYLVVFADSGPTLSQEDVAHLAKTTDEGAVQLERELRETRERLQSLVEEYETALEELKSSNEELVSVNEELQSTNEELEASKEELQSLNEELHTVNSELGAKVEQLDRANSDLTNLFESTRVATLFLDRNLIIRSFTPAVSQIFSILPGDRGRPLTDLASRVALTGLIDDVNSVFASGVTLERSIATGVGGAQFLMRLVAYRDSSSHIDGVVITFVDVTSLTKAEAQQRVLIAELNHRVKNMLMVVIGVAEQTYRTSANSLEFKERLIERILGMSRSYELLSRENWTETLLRDAARPHLEAFGLERVSLQGPDVRLKPAQALAFGMIVHELATNAGKYGAFRRDEGSVTLTWEAKQVGDAARVGLTWRERDGPPVSDPGKTGFGLRLVKEQAAYGLHGSADVEFAPTGLLVRMTFPLKGWDDE